MTDCETAYRALEDAALAHTKGDLMTGRELMKASLAHAAAHALETQTRAQHPAPQKPPESKPAGPTTFPPFGRAGGKPIKGAAVDDLRFFEAWARKAVDGWVQRNQQLLDAVRAELRQRGEAADHGS